MNTANIQTGLLNYFINVEKINKVAVAHKSSIKEIKKFKPTSKTQKAYKTAYAKFIRSIDKADLTVFGFEIKSVLEDACGNLNTYYKSPVENFGWSELFEAVHLNIVK